MNHIVAMNRIADFNAYAWITIICVAAGVVFLFVQFYKRYLGTGRETSLLLALFTLFASVATGLFLANEWGDDRSMLHEELVKRSVFATLLVLTGLPLGIKLYRSWMGGCLTEAEKAAGAPGVRAWLSPANLVLALLVSISAHQAFDYPFIGVLAFTILALMAQPAMTTLSQPGPSGLPSGPADNLTAEREKVLSLLEAGKITAEESAELLNALGTTLKAPETPRVAFSSENRAMFIGAAIVLVGFFLPWFTINVGAQLAKLTGDMQKWMNAPSSSDSGPVTFNFHENPLSVISPHFGQDAVTICGGDVAHGIGWMILLLSVGTALLPLVAAQLDPHTRRTGSMVALGLGTLLLGYVLTNAPGSLNVGIMLTGAGYVAQWFCLMKRRATAPPAPSAVGEHA